MDPIATLLMLADTASAADCREHRNTMREWIRKGGFPAPVSALAGKVSKQRIAAWKRLGWVK